MSMLFPKYLEKKIIGVIFEIEEVYKNSMVKSH